MGGTSKSTSSQIQTQQEIVDSYNTTVNEVQNLSAQDVGNIKINVPEAAGAGLGLSPTMIAVIGAGILGAVFLFRK